MKITMLKYNFLLCILLIGLSFAALASKIAKIELVMSEGMEIKAKITMANIKF